MPRLEWDKNEERQFEMGVSKMVLFPKKTDGSIAETIVCLDG